MNTNRTPGIGPLTEVFGSGSHWAGKQSVSAIEQQAKLALFEAQCERRAFSGIAFPGDYLYRPRAAMDAPT